jgi:hypothetical protein
MRLEHHSVQVQEVLGSVYALPALVAGRHVGDPPMRRLALAVDTEACRLGLDDKTIVLQFAEPVRDVVSVFVAEIFACIAKAEIDMAVVPETPQSKRDEK